MSFPGFSIFEETAFPPELVDLLPSLDTFGELKVLLCILDRFIRAGNVAVPLTLDEFQQATGLSRKAVVSGLRRARERGVVVRQDVRGVYEYAPCVTQSVLRRLPCMLHTHTTSNTKNINQHVHDMFVSESTCVTREQIRRVLVEEFGVADHVAHDIATYRQPEFVWQQIEYTRYEVGQGTVHSIPAYVVARIRDGWGPPKGYLKKNKRWYSDEEYELYFVHPESCDEEEA